MTRGDEKVNPLPTSSESPLRQAWQLLRKAAHYQRAEDVGSLSGLRGIEPIELEGNSPSVLCFHGFCGAPGEVSLCAQVGADLGLRARAPLLRGHGTTPRDLSSLNFFDWLDGVRSDFEELRSQGPVILAGLSMGSLIATALALESPSDVAGLILLSNAFWLKTPFPGVALDLVDRLGLPDFGVPKLRSDLGDEEAARTHVSYQIQPTRAAISVMHAGRRLRQQLPEIQCPTLILHGALDRVCPVANAWKVAGKLGSRDTRVVIFPRSYHIVTKDVEREQVRRELRHFMKGIRKTTRKTTSD